MTVQLIRHTFPDRLDWTLINDEVPLGTKFEVLGFHSKGLVFNSDLCETRDADLYLLVGNDGYGWLPAICFEVIKNEIN